jgi:hypothetical protein
VKSPEQMAQERKAWAADLLIRAWRRVEICATAPAASDKAFDRVNTALVQAVAIAEEWGLDPKAVLEDAYPAEMRARE